MLVKLSVRKLVSRRYRICWKSRQKYRISSV